MSEPFVRTTGAPTQEPIPLELTVRTASSEPIEEATDENRSALRVLAEPPGT
jgi:hypothetical protein